jgi:hypothetical protein
MKTGLLLALLMLLPRLNPTLGEEVGGSKTIENAIMDSDEVRMLYLVSKSVDTLTGFRTTTQKGKKVLADVFSKAELVGWGSSDGSGDPTGGGGFATRSGMRINVYKNAKLTLEIVVVGFDYVHVIRPKDSWYEASFKDAPKDDNSLSVYDSLIELRILRDVKKAAATGSWEEVLSNLKDFMPAGIDDSIKK